MRFDNTAVVRTMMAYLNKAISTKWVQVGCVIAFIGLLASGIAGRLGN